MGLIFILNICVSFPLVVIQYGFSRLAKMRGFSILDQVSSPAAYQLFNSSLT